ncbi:hypothetical protein DFH07DRAFT_782615 [Mycena maculata]|uniref:Uncharacterized protein n=1 Tax=Mycena maculata TaxID=230809 RepID=A0AAD7HRT5_9AGAR|nr:hypothetical protein DFH07DRAFT_782615 [Mycena maculata]
MAAKTLSTSTLSLKFMQNAHRAKNLAEVQLEKADVKDDGEWEVAQEIRDAWGPETTQSVSYEASYLPFLFASDAPDNTTPAAKGRRAFKRGREVADDYQTIVPAVPTPPAASSSKTRGKLQSISSAPSGRPSPKKANNNSGPKGRTARQAIYDSSGVGADLRAQKSAPASASNITNVKVETPPAPTPNMFLKPVGVDEPAESTKGRSIASASKPPTPDSDERKPRVKREREPAAESTDGESNKKRKKKKKGDQSAAVQNSRLDG